METAPDGRRPRKLAKRLGISFASLLVALAIAEIGARIHLGSSFATGVFFGPAMQITGRYDPDLGWTNRADVSVTIAGPGFRYRVNSNSRGLRDREYDYEPADGVLRVVLLGDSTAWGWGVDDDEAFASVLDEELGPGVEIINLAVPGYSTDQQLMAFEGEGRKYRPDLVILPVVFNDIVSNQFPISHGMQKPHWVRNRDGTWEVANRPVPPPAAGDKIANRRRRRMMASYVALLRLLEPPIQRSARPPLTDPELEHRQRKTWDELCDPKKPTHMLLARMKETADEMGADMLAFVLPHMTDRYLYDPSEPPPADAPEAGFATYGTQRLRQAGEMIGFRTLSVDDALLEVVRKGVDLDCGDEHLNARGNQIIAGCLLPVLEEWAAERRAR